MQFSSDLEWVLNVMVIGAAIATAAYEAGSSPESVMESGRWKSKHSMSFVWVNLLGLILSAVFLGQFICFFRPVT